MNEILVEGKYTLEQFREMVDKQSGIPGLPGIIVHSPIEEALMESNFAYRVTNALDGMIELVPYRTLGLLNTNES